MVKVMLAIMMMITTAVLDVADNCRKTPNPDQADHDTDGVGMLAMFAPTRSGATVDAQGAPIFRATWMAMGCRHVRLRTISKLYEWRSIPQTNPIASKADIDHTEMSMPRLRRFHQMFKRLMCLCSRRVRIECIDRSFYCSSGLEF